MRFLLTWIVALFCLPGAAMAKDWTKSVAATPAGGYLIGNPAAPVKVVEFFSLTCPHCKHFTETGLPALKTNYVANGKVSLELRNFVLNPPDLAASLLMRCGSPALAVKLFDAVYADQENLFAPSANLSSDAMARINAIPTAQRGAAYAREAGIEKWFVARGVPAKRASACLADTKRTQQLVSLREEAVNKLGVEGTPSFIVNGKLVGGGQWSDLEPAIKNAMGAGS
jgi:protein-disulfide isomerase